VRKPPAKSGGSSRSAPQSAAAETPQAKAKVPISKAKASSSGSQPPSKAAIAAAGSGAPKSQSGSAASSSGNKGGGSIGGKKSTDLPAHTLKLLAEYGSAGEDSVYFDNQKNHAQLRSIMRYENIVREKLSFLTKGTENHNMWTVILKRLQLIELGIQIQRKKGGSAKGAASLALQDYKQLTTLVNAFPEIPEYVQPEALEVTVLEFSCEVEFGGSKATAAVFAKRISFFPEGGFSFIILGVDAVLRRDDESATTVIVDRLRTALAEIIVDNNLPNDKMVEVEDFESVLGAYKEDTTKFL